jgi:hypothetical protein
MLPRLKVIQVGDIHLEASAKRGRVADDKDPHFPQNLRASVSANPLKAVFRKIYETLAVENVSAVLFMGDFSDRGNIETYRSCARYVAEALEIGIGRTYSNLPVGIAPGNHDIDRSLALEPGLTRKFQPLNVALHSNGLRELPVEHPQSFKIGTTPSEANIHLLNSCWGCGEKEFIPEQFREAISDAIKTSLARGSSGDALAEYYNRQLDTPAFSASTVQELRDAIGQSSQSQLSIVVGHHNLLPQRLPRFAPYTELVNSGALRSTLLDCKRPILYLHGHIHDDPIEIILAPAGMPLLSIAAPEVIDGFNVIDIIFTHLGLPLSCQISPWRFDHGGVLRPLDRIDIPLIGYRVRSQGRPLALLYAKLLEARECYWSEALAISRRISPSYTEADLLEDVELLQADGSIIIDNYAMPTEHWLIGARI